MAKLFKSDGVCGLVNKGLTAELALKLGQAAVRFQGKKILIGRDARQSGFMLEAAVVAGVTSMGGDVLLAGVVPAPAVALLVRELACDGGIVISSECDSPEYNSIKFFDGEGCALSDEVEDVIEMFVMGSPSADMLATGDATGGVTVVGDAIERYVFHVVTSVQEQGVRFKGLKVALDFGHGVALDSSAEVLRRLGADVVVVGDGRNAAANESYDTDNLRLLRELVREASADVGIARDGDAGRVMMIDSQGTEISCDAIEATIAIDLKKRNLLAGNSVVNTTMCNRDFIECMKAHGINVVQAEANNRSVLKKMREHSYVIGGEQSGHIILLENGVVADGLMVACQFLAAVKRNGNKLDKHIEVMKGRSQRLVSVCVSNKDAIYKNSSVAMAVASVKSELGGAGRVVLCPSENESLIYILVEAEGAATVARCCRMIAEIIKTELS